MGNENRECSLVPSYLFKIQCTFSPSRNSSKNKTTWLTTFWPDGPILIFWSDADDKCLLTSCFEGGISLESHLIGKFYVTQKVQWAFFLSTLKYYFWSTD